MNQSYHFRTPVRTGRRDLTRLGAVFVVLGALVFAGIYVWRLSVLLEAAESQTELRLEAHAETLSTVLDKHRALSVLIARRPDIVVAVAGGGIDRATLTQRLAAVSGSLGMALVSADRGLLAADRVNEEIFSAPDPRLSAAITAALQGRLGRAYGAYTEDRDAVYAFLAPVFGDGPILGFVVSLVGLEDVENTWALASERVAAVTEDGEVFLSNVSVWRQRREAELFPPAARKSTTLDSLGSDFSLTAVLTLPIVDWKIFVQRSLAPERTEALIIAAFATALMIILGLTATIILQRRRQLMEQYQQRDEYARNLEEQVKLRTYNLERSNRQLQEAQENLVTAGKLALLGQMSASISHELSQPLGAIKIYARNTRRMLESEQPDAAGENLTAIERVVDRVTRIIRNLRVFAVEDQVDARTIDVTRVTDEAMAEFLERTPEARRWVKLQHGEAGLEALAGEVRLLQVLQNLMGNAWSSCKETDAPDILISTGRRNGAVRISVADNGPGIPPELQDDIFGAFVSTRAHGGGMGLGLTISRSFIQSMGGEIELTKADAGGAEFVITLKVAEG